MTMAKIADEINYYKIAAICIPYAEDKPSRNNLYERPEITWNMILCPGRFRRTKIDPFKTDFFISFTIYD
jgi:hypothetical protein